MDSQIENNKILNQQILNESGEKLILKEILNNDINVVLLLRHFGWIFCRKQIQEVLDNKNNFDERNIKIIAVGNGQSTFIKGFKNDLSTTFDVYTDPTLKLYELVNAKKGAGAILHPRALLNYFLAFAQGNKNNSIMGNTTQQGGALIIFMKDKKIISYTNGVAGDSLNSSQIINLLNIQ